MDLNKLVLDNTHASKEDARYFLTTPLVCISEDYLNRLPDSAVIGDTPLSIFKQCIYKKLKSGETVYVKAEDDSLIALVVGVCDITPKQSDALFQEVGDAFNAAYAIVDYQSLAEELGDINALGVVYKYTDRPYAMLSVVRRDINKDASHFALLDLADNTVYDYDLHRFKIPFNKYKEELQKEYWIGRM